MIYLTLLLNITFISRFKSSSWKWILISWLFYKWLSKSNFVKIYYWEDKDHYLTSEYTRPKVVKNLDHFIICKANIDFGNWKLWDFSKNINVITTHRGFLSSQLSEFILLDTQIFLQGRVWWCLQMFSDPRKLSHQCLILVTMRRPAHFTTIITVHLNYHSNGEGWRRIS